MNGRAYDYNLGRFLSVDPIIQFPANSQSLNPYSYLMNNPMSGTDPSGYFSCGEAVRTKTNGGCTRGSDPNDWGSRWSYGLSVINGGSSASRTQSNGANQTASSTSASTQVPEINSPSDAGKTSDASAETNPYGPYPPFSVTRNLESYAIAGTEPNFRVMSSEVSFLIALGITFVSSNNGFGGENAPGDDSIEGGAFSPLGVAKGVGAAAGSLVLRRGASVAKGVDELFKAGRTPKASELKKFAEQQGWKPSQSANGPLKYVDESGINRLTIKQGSSRAPGSANPHVELRNASGQRIDPTGNPVARKNPGNHIPIDFDL